jgi:putative membrane protein
MRIGKTFGLFLYLTGMGAFAAFGQQLPNQGQQPPSNSPLPAANDPLPGGTTNDKTGSAGDTMRDAQSRQMDKRFLLQVAQASMLTIEMGKLASEKGSSEEVRKLGAKMMQDHTRGLEIFKRVAVKDGVELPAALDSKHKERLDKLAKLSGTEFDRAYVKDQIKAHQRLVSYFESESDNSSDTAAKKLATNMLPAIQKHLDMFKDVNKTLLTTAAK